jgi:TPR repeat protein
MKAASGGPSASSSWIDEWAKTNFHIASLKRSSPALWLAGLERMVKDPSVQSEAAKDAGQALVLVLAYGAPGIPKDTKRAFEVACDTYQWGYGNSYGHVIVEADGEAAAEAALAVGAARPKDLVQLGLFLKASDLDTAEKLFRTAMEYPELRFEALWEYGLMLDTKSPRGPEDEARAFQLLREACDMYEKQAVGSRSSGEGALMRVAEMYEKGRGTAKNPTMAIHFAAIAAKG